MGSVEVEALPLSGMTHSVEVHLCCSLRSVVCVMLFLPLHVQVLGVLCGGLCGSRGGPNLQGQQGTD